MDQPDNKIRARVALAELEDLRAIEAYLRQGRQRLVEQRVRQLCMTMQQGIVVNREAERLTSNMSASLSVLSRYRTLIARNVAEGPYHHDATTMTPRDA
jgi:hypothetical protein